MAQQQLADKIRVIDVDSHLLEPADLWSARLPSKWSDLYPHVIFDEKAGIERWQIGNDRVNGVGWYATAGWHEPFPSMPRSFDDVDQGSWNPTARLQRMSEYGIFAQVLFPNLLGFHIWAFLKLDPDVRLRCVQVYNDFQIEFCSKDPNRLIPLANLPFWDLDASVKELQRCADMGHKGVNFGADFEKFGMPRLRDNHWAPLLSLAQDLELPLNFHIGFSKTTEDEVVTSATAQDTLDVAKKTALMFIGNATTISEIIMSGLCQRYPRLNFVSVESGYGYVPFLLQALDWQFLNMGVPQAHPEYMLPSEYFRRQIYATFWFEREIDMVAHQYPDNVMFESDYPHSTSLSPGDGCVAQNARDTIEQNLAHLPEGLLNKLLHDNAARLFHLG